jgi:hypothetical protein
VKRRASRARTLEGELGAACLRAAAEERAGQYPLTKYQRDPVAYAHERLKIDRLFPKQVESLEALARGVNGEIDPQTGRRAVDRIAIRSGQKSGKTKTAIIAALWFFECFAEARVFLCAAIEAQTRNVMWRELTNTIRQAREQGADIDGKLSPSPAGGLKSTDGRREIIGISGREIEAVAGLSGKMLTIIDEASHLPENKAQAFSGNTMGGGSLFFISNPTKNEGPFYDAFHAMSDFWRTFHIDCEALAQWQHDTGISIPYTATLAKIDEFRRMYGEDSPFWFLRVKGEWLRNETGRAIPMARIDEAIARHSIIEENGLLSIGYDCAGPGNGGDEHVWAVVRGLKLIALFRRRGLDTQQALEQTDSILDTFRREDETPRITVDSEGPIGAEIYGRLRAIQQTRLIEDPRKGFELEGVKASDRKVRDATKFERVRDELVWNLAEWLREGAIPKDHKLQTELYAPEWQSLPDGKLKSTPKPMLRDKLGHSPDSFDALALAVRRPFQWIPEGDAPKGAKVVSIRAERAPREFDPYDSKDRPDPYGKQYLPIAA